MINIILICLMTQFNLNLNINQNHWIPITGCDGWEGYGTVCPICKTIVPEKWRHISNPNIEIKPEDIENYQLIIKNIDPYGFINWLNNVRASYGLGLVGYDPNLSVWAAMNNDYQTSYGIGHFIMGPARRQNAAMGTYPGIESMWMSSPAHRAALLDPSIRWIGIAGLGVYWTFNAN